MAARCSRRSRTGGKGGKKGGSRADIAVDESNKDRGRSYGTAVPVGLQPRRVITAPNYSIVAVCLVFLFSRYCFVLLAVLFLLFFLSSCDSGVIHTHHSCR